MTNEITKYDDVIDLHDVIARVEGLREEREAIAENGTDCESEYDAAIRENLKTWDAENGEELATLEALLAECKGAGGDEQWEGDWYPVTLVRDSYFEDYAQELADDIGAINTEIGWPNNCIDWGRAARELQQDYTSVEFDDVTYWTR